MSVRALFSRYCSIQSTSAELLSFNLLLIQKRNVQKLSKNENNYKKTIDDTKTGKIGDAKTRNFPFIKWKSKAGKTKQEPEKFAMPPDFAQKLQDWPKFLQMEKKMAADAIINQLASGTLEELTTAGVVISNLRRPKSPTKIGLTYRVMFERRQPDTDNIPLALLGIGSPVNIAPADDFLHSLCQGTLVGTDQRSVHVFFGDMQAQKMLDTVFASDELQANSDTEFVVVPSTTNPTIERLIDFTYQLSKSKRPETMGCGLELVQYAYRAKSMRYVSIDNTRLKYFDPNLNESQRQSVAAALNPKRPLLTIQGPPGTGKTAVIVEIIRQAAERQQKVLVCAPSNVAVDNILLRLLNDKLSPDAQAVGAVRLGFCDQVQCQTMSVYSQLDQAGINESLLRLYKANRSLDELLDATELNQSAIDIQKRKVRQLEFVAKKEILLEKRVYFSTVTSAMLDQLKRIQPDLTIVDEAAQALECATWLGAILSKRCVLVGDPCQLPPVVLSDDKEKTTFSTSLMEHLHKEFAPGRRVLTVQYRMNEKIARWSSRYFYGSELRSHESVADIRLSDISSVPLDSVLNEPLLLIDTAGVSGMGENYKTVQSSSSRNMGEARLVHCYVRHLVACGVAEKDIAVITPYASQVGLVKKLLSKEAPNVLVNTVDGFQGQQKEVIILSMVRSNRKGSTGFLSDSRRLNVSVTRAKRHLAVIADSRTVCRLEHIKSFIDLIGDIGKVQSAGEYTNEIAKLPVTKEFLSQRSGRKQKNLIDSTRNRSSTISERKKEILERFESIDKENFGKFL